jgi:hypothetical protein
MVTTKETIKADGMWAKVGRKNYLHESGNMVSYDCNAWLWRVNQDEGYKTLWAAKHAAETRVKHKWKD